MSLLHDLNDYKLETRFQRDPECIVHSSYRTDRARGIGKVLVEEKWISDVELGAGGFGTVRLERQLEDHKDRKGTSTSSIYRAVKVLNKSRLNRQKIDYNKELVALTKFSRTKFAHYQIFVDFFGWFEDATSIFLAMEYVPHGTLDRYVNPELVEQDARVISLQLLEGLKIMHEEGFTHRDLKPQNIFVVQKDPTYWVKIGDFGITKRVSNDTALRTTTGTAYYLAPEVSHHIDTGENDETSTYTNAVDIWSFGCVVYEMMALQVPFLSTRSLVIFCRGGPFPETPLRGRTSFEGIEFIKRVLVALPKYRPSAKEALENEWLHHKEDIRALQSTTSSEATTIRKISKAEPPQTASTNSDNLFPASSQDSTRAFGVSQLSEVIDNQRTRSEEPRLAEDPNVHVGTPNGMIDSTINDLHFKTEGFQAVQRQEPDPNSGVMTAGYRKKLIKEGKTKNPVKSLLDHVRDFKINSPFPKRSKIDTPSASANIFNPRTHDPPPPPPLPPGDQPPVLPPGRKVSSLEVRDLNELIRKRYALDLDIWRLRKCAPRDRNIVEDRMHRSDAALLKIMVILQSWDNPELWESPADYMKLMAIRGRLESEQGKRTWIGNPPWEDY